MTIEGTSLTAQELSPDDQFYCYNALLEVSGEEAIALLKDMVIRCGAEQAMGFIAISLNAHYGSWDIPQDVIDTHWNTILYINKQLINQN